MALNPRGTRQRDGAAQLSQNRPEYRLFDENSSSAISPIIEVWNEPVVIHAHALAPGQGIAVDCVSDYDNNPIYTPFTPIRGAPIVLTEDLTSVILFFSGRYVLRLTGGGLGTVKAFAYPFSVSHDWGDYYGGLGFGGNVVTSIDDIDTNTIDITLNPDPGTGDVTIRADAILSPDADNIQEFRANGFFVQGPDNGNIINVPTSVLDTATIDMTLVANVLSAVVIRSPDAGQILELRGNGVYVPGPQLGDPTQVPTSVLDTLSVDLTLAANVLSADVIISPNPGNALSLLANGLFVTGFAGTITTAADTATVDHTVAAGVLTSDVIISPNAGNIITALGNGLYAAGFAGTITSATDSATIDHTVAAGVLSSQVIRSPDAGNVLELRGNGVYVPTPSAGAVTSVADTQSIDLTLAVGVLTADLRIDPSAENVLNLGAPGVLVEAATTAEEEAETAGDLVITAAVLGHIVNARTGQQCAHLGVNAGALAFGQVSVGHSSGTGVTNFYNTAIGLNAGQGITGLGNIHIGSNNSSGTVANAGRNYVIKIGSESYTGNSPWAAESVLIGAFTYNNAVNSAGLIAPPNVVAIGPRALLDLDYNSVTGCGSILSIGNFAGSAAKFSAANGQYTFVGADAGRSSRGYVSCMLGSAAGASIFASHLGIVGTTDCFGHAAGYNAYNQAFTKDFNGMVCVGGASAFNARFPSKTYVFDDSKFGITPPAFSEYTDPYGIATEFKAPSGVENVVAIADIDNYSSLNFGSSAAGSAHIAQNVSIGTFADSNAYNFGATNIGHYAGNTAASEESVAVGFYSGVTAKVTKCVAIGPQAGSEHVFTAAICANFNGAAFNGTTTITVPAHTLAVGEYHVLRFSVIAGTPPAQLVDGAIFVGFATSNVQFVLLGISPAAGAIGTFSLTAVEAQVNNIVIGYKANNVLLSNDITLGNADHETLHTAAKIYPGDEAGGFQTAAGMYGCTGAPNNANGNDGDFCFRSDGGAGTTIYHKRAGVWVGVV